MSLDQYEVWAQLSTFRRRVERARAVLRDAASKGRLGVFTSWGKDSIVCAGLAIEALGRVPLLHLASTYELPGNDETIDWFRARADVVTVPPSRSLDDTIEWLQEIGLNHERRADPGKAAKIDRGRATAAEHGIEVQVMGLRTDESKGRNASRSTRGLLYRTRSGLWTCTPIADWHARDVWAFIVSRKIPYNRRVYDAETHGMTRETIRNSGWLTTFGACEGRITWLRQHFPNQYRQLETAFPRIALLT